MTELSVKTILLNPWTITIVGGLIVAIFSKWLIKKNKKSDVVNTVANNNNQTVNIITNQTSFDDVQDSTKKMLTIDEKKKLLSILFIDNDTRFKIVKILEKQGYKNINIIKDVTSLEDEIIKTAHIFFVDINDVGLELGFVDQGLGLALKLKEKYPDKKVVIYSAETQGDRFHKALRQVDDFLPKNAEPQDFISLVDSFRDTLIF